MRPWIQRYVRVRTVRGRGAWHATDAMLVGFSPVLSMLMLTLFMSPSEDRTSQTVFLHQLLFAQSDSERLVWRKTAAMYVRTVCSMRM